MAQVGAKKNANRCRLALKPSEGRKKIMNFNDVSTPDKTIASGSDLWPRSAAAL